jgi:hypothetical protein
MSGGRRIIERGIWAAGMMALRIFPCPSRYRGQCFATGGLATHSAVRCAITPSHKNRGRPPHGPLWRFGAASGWGLSASPERAAHPGASDIEELVLDRLRAFFPPGSRSLTRSRRSILMPTRLVRR